MQPTEQTAAPAQVDNPFASAAGSNPFGAGAGGMSTGVKEFKWKDPNAIDLGD